MARQESDREDLLREATALVERVEFAAEDAPDPIVVGFRRDGSCSIFFGAEPVYQFNRLDELRRAYHQGLLVKAEAGQLVTLKRVRSEGEVALVRRTLDTAQTHAFLQEMHGRLISLQDALQAGKLDVNGQVPDNVDVSQRVLKWLLHRPESISIAEQPNVGR